MGSNNRVIFATIFLTGYCAGFEEVVVKGSLDEFKFVAYYIK